MTRLLLILFLALTQTGCDAKLDTGLFPWSVRSLDNVRKRLEQEKRDSVKTVDEQVGQGSLAAWGRRIKADVDIRYADGSVVYKAPSSSTPDSTLPWTMPLWRPDTSTGDKLVSSLD